MRVEPVGGDELATLAVVDFLVAQAERIAVVPVHMPRALRNLWDTILNGVVYAAIDDGKVIGSLGLNKSPLTWYCHESETCYVDEWLVAEEGGGIALLKAAAADLAPARILVRRVRWGKEISGDILGANVVGVVGRILEVG